jgi:RHS repeat-associated protein
VALPAETVTTDYGKPGLPLSSSSSLGDQYSTVTYSDYQGHAATRTWGAGSTGARRTYTRDPLTLTLTNATTTWQPTAATVQNDTYAYDNTGNVTEIASATDSQQQCYGYDDLNRLTSAFTTTTATPTSCAGATANHTGATAPYDLAYTYDKLGNITTTVDKITNVTSSYAYGDAAHVHAVTAIAHTGGATGTDTYAYNAYGAMNSRTVGATATTLVYNSQDRVQSITKGSSSSTYVYDISGQVLIRRTNAETVLYLPGQELHLAGTTVRPTRFYSCGAVVALRVGDVSSPNGVLTWLANDTQGSAQLSIAPATGAVARQRYLPYGAQRGTQGPPTGSERGFLGRNTDPTAGLLQDGARFYDTAIGRFTSPDPVLRPLVPQSLSSFSYADNNPTTMSDPTGLSPVACIDTCSTAHGALPPIVRPVGSATIPATPPHTPGTPPPPPPVCGPISGHQICVQPVNPTYKRKDVTSTEEQTEVVTPAVGVTVAYCPAGKVCDVRPGAYVVCVANGQPNVACIVQQGGLFGFVDPEGFDPKEPSLSDKVIGTLFTDVTDVVNVLPNCIRKGGCPEAIGEFFAQSMNDIVHGGPGGSVYGRNNSHGENTSPEQRQFQYIMAMQGTYESTGVKVCVGPPEIC